MKKAVAVILLLCICLLGGCSSRVKSTVLHGFVNTDWKASPGAVIAQQTEGILEVDKQENNSEQKNSIVSYKDVTVFNYPATQQYVFRDRQLVAVTYMFSMGNSSGTKYLEAFVTVEKQLRAKYGEPDISYQLGAEGIDGIIFAADELDAGSLALFCLWQIGNETIGLSLSGPRQASPAMFEQFYNFGLSVQLQEKR